MRFVNASDDKINAFYTIVVNQESQSKDGEWFGY